MDACCDESSRTLSILRENQASVLKLVLAINASMFLVESIAGLIAGSAALLGDSLDMLGDSLVYGFTLYVLHRSPAWRARAALLKGIIMLLFGVGVLFVAARVFVSGEVPSAEMIGAVGALALVFNALCFFLLFRHRSDDLNMRSTWLCSRNDIVANVAVLAAAGAVYISQSAWPDLLVGVAVAFLFLRSAASVIGAATKELAQAHAAEAATGGDA